MQTELLPKQAPKQPPEVACASNLELVQILAPRAGELLKTYSLAGLERAGQTLLEQESSPASGRKLAAAFELGRRAAAERRAVVPLDSPECTYDYFAPQIRHLPCESLRVALLDTRLRATRFVIISHGSVNETIAHPRDILHPAVLHQAHAFLLVHNHPSGDPSPSRADRELTRRVSDAAGLLQINFIDHVIIGRATPCHSAYFSFGEAGLL